MHKRQITHFEFSVRQFFIFSLSLRSSLLFTVALVLVLFESHISLAIGLEKLLYAVDKV